MIYYVFDTEQIAIDAELYIRGIAQMPFIGVNAATGEPKPTAQKTERWATPQQRLDGKWVFPTVPIAIAQNFGQEVIDYFNKNYPHHFEQFKNEWFEENNN